MLPRMRFPALFILLLVSIARAAERPNILFIMTDDHAMHAMSCYGSKVNETPHMDRIAKDGMRFTNAFVTNSICTPSRATILTRKYSHRNGTPVFIRFDGAQQNVAKLLQAAGYHTGMVGKWHLGQKDLTRRDLKLVPPAELKGPDRNKWLTEKPESVAMTDADGTKMTLLGEALVHWKYQRYLQDYLACVQSVDDNIGRALDYLEKTGRAKDTIVFYTSDDGFFLGDSGMFDKRFMQEPSLRVPLLVRGPGVKAGALSDLFALNNDFAPTFLDLAGLPIPAEMQGRSLLPLLRGEPPGDWRKAMDYRYYHDPGDHNTRAHYGVRTATHKLIYYYKKDAWEMFDLRSDPTEQKNIAGDEKEAARRAELKAELARLRKEFKDDDQFAETIPPNGVDGAAKEKTPLGVKTAAEAIGLTAGR